MLKVRVDMEQTERVKKALEEWVSIGARRVEMVEGISCANEAGDVELQPSGETVRLTYCLFDAATGSQVGTIRYVLRGYPGQVLSWWEANRQGIDVLKAAGVPMRRMTEEVRGEQADG